jgi:hypothetical protein
MFISRAAVSGWVTSTRFVSFPKPSAIRRVIFLKLTDHIDIFKPLGGLSVPGKSHGRRETEGQKADRETRDAEREMRK